MADSPAPGESLVKRDRELPDHDPIVSRSTSGWMLACALLMTISIVWALWDEAFGQRPWKSMQREFVSRYTRYLDSIKAKSGQTEKEIRESPEFIQLDDAVTAANQEIDPRRKEIDTTVERVQKKLDAITEPFQNQRGRLTVIGYNIETHEGSAKEKYRRQAQNKRAEPITV
ncbi:MAG TPA: hypothetical protein VFB65_16320, partial [Pyrinomonadaceae bacterium]|nr:hypothetical protein [Pyrinomonadaceae bacterium]